MRLVATALLAAMAAMLLLARHLAATEPRWGWLRAFAEAALVGGLADWFAVTALFRHPLGLPIPHTAIIPENKHRIAETMAAFLRAHFLTPQVVSRRLAAMNLAAAAGRLLADPRRLGEARLRQGAVDLLGDLLHALDDAALRGLIASAARRQLHRLDAASLLGGLVEGALADRRHLPLVEAALRWLGEMLAAHEPLLRAMIRERANALLRWTGLDERLANALLDGAYRLLAESIVDPEHPLRRTIEARLATLADALLHDSALRQRVAAARDELLASPAAAAAFDGLWHRARAALLAAAGDPQRALAGSLGAGIASFGATLRDDARLQRVVNRVARRTLAGLVARHGDAIVALVADTVKRWDAQTVTARIERVVGRDLQFIRLNGTLVGGVIGLVLYALDRFT
ncbi:MAG: DUF445 domain-containing protein [Sphingomonadales bacterium]|nr:DUF445 domain-containing protein [Sphingomonadales bacterium]